MKKEELVLAEQQLEHAVFKTVLNVGAGNTSTTKGKEEIMQAVHQFLDAINKQPMFPITPWED